MSRLSREGEAVRQAIGAAGYEITPNQMADAIVDARERVQPGPDGCCVRCGHSGDGRDYRYGVCDRCAFCAEPDCHQMCDEWGEGTMCPDHAARRPPTDRERDDGE